MQRALTVLLLLGALLILHQTVGQRTSVPASTPTVEPPTVVSTTTVRPATTSTTTPKVEDSPTTTTSLVEIDYPDPVRLSIPPVEIDAPVDATGPTFGSNEWYPDWGRLEWWHDDALGAPCETGPVFIMGHVTKGDVFHDLISDERSKDGSTGVAAGGDIDITLEDDTVCRYRVVTLEEAAGQPLGPNEVTGDKRPGWYVLKNGFGGEPRETLIELTGNINRLFLFTSYAGHCGCGFEQRDGGSHRIYSAYVAADLVEVIPPEEG